MPPHPWRVLHGTAVAQPGVERSFSGWEFAPAGVELNGRTFHGEFDLSDAALRELVPEELTGLVRSRKEALWLRPRIESEFQVRCPREDARPEKTLMFFGFLARRGPELPAFPFWCEDHHGKAALTFSPAGPGPEIRRSIGEAFWKLLLSASPTSDYEDSMFHTGCGLTIRFGRRLGKWFYENAENGESQMK